MAKNGSSRRTHAKGPLWICFTRGGKTCGGDEDNNLAVKKEELGVGDTTIRMGCPSRTEEAQDEEEGEKRGCGMVISHTTFGDDANFLGHAGVTSIVTVVFREHLCLCLYGN